MQILHIALVGAVFVSCSASSIAVAPAIDACAIDYDARHWDLGETMPGGDSLQVTYHTVSHDLHLNLDDDWNSMEPYCGICAKYIPETTPSAAVFPRGMALPL